MLKTPENLTSIQAEKIIVGACLFSQKAAVLVIDTLKPEHFSDEFHQLVWREIITAAAEGKQASPASIAAKHGLDTDTTNGLTAYARDGMLCLDPTGIAEELIELHAKRSLRNVCMETQERLENPEGRVCAEIKADLDGALFAYERNCGADGFATDRQATLEIVNQMKRGDKPYATGLDCLNNAMDGGLYPGFSYGFVARKKCGKTILAGTLSDHLNRSGTKHLFMCGEMGYREIHGRILAKHMNIKPSDFRKRTHDVQFMADLVGAAEQMPENVIYKNIQYYTLEQVIQTVTSAIYRHGITGFILDYWQLVGGKQKGQSTAEHLDRVAQWIADFCRKHNLWSITMGQVNQEGNTRGGEGLRLAFDQVYEIKRPEDDESDRIRWFEMMETRYTAWKNMGNVQNPDVIISQTGLVFEPIDKDARYSSLRKNA